MNILDDISKVMLSLIRVGTSFRFIYCMVMLQGAEDEAGIFKTRLKHAVIFYIISECVWQLKEIVLYYYAM